LLKFDRREGFHQPPLMYDTQITVCPVYVFIPPKCQVLVSTLTVMWYTTQKNGPHKNTVRELASEPQHTQAKKTPKTRESGSPLSPNPHGPARHYAITL